jgi:DNA-binding Lrp family transcriptional regulator
MSEIDNVDSKILQALVNNARSKVVDIAKDCKLSSTAVKERILRMKKRGLIVKAVLSINMSSLGYPLPVLMGVALKCNQDCSIESQIVELVKQHTKVAGIDYTLGKYDLCLFVFAKNVDQLDRLKKLIRKQKEVRNIQINIWNRFYLNYNNLDIFNRGG